jgi:uncharacterized protein
MIAVDTNILVYAYVPRLAQHEPARAAIDRLIAAGKPWAIPWPCVHEFIAVVSNRKWHADAPSATQIAAHVEVWMEAPGLRMLGIGSEHWPHLRRVLELSGASGGQVHDARIVAVCAEAGVTEIWTADRDFSRFPGIRIHNPLLVP